MPAMGILANPRHERFAQGLAAGKSASQAYVDAGYSRNDGNAGRMNRNEQIRLRVSELQKENSMISRISREDIISRLLENVEEATEAKQHAAAGASIERLAKLLGYWTDRQEIRQVSELDGIDDPDELRAKLIKMAREMGEDGIADAMEGKPH
jgi:phage terminase small subunit